MSGIAIATALIHGNETTALCILALAPPFGLSGMISLFGFSAYCTRLASRLGDDRASSAATIYGVVAANGWILSTLGIGLVLAAPMVASVFPLLFLIGGGLLLTMPARLMQVIGDARLRAERHWRSVEETDSSGKDMG